MVDHPEFEHAEKVEISGAVAQEARKTRRHQGRLHCAAVLFILPLSFHFQFQEEMMPLNKKSYVLSITSLCIILVAPIHAQDGGALIKHIMYQEFDKAKELIKQGVDVNYQDETYGSTALLLSCQYGFVDMAKYLVEKGADLNIQAKNGTSPLMASAGVSLELSKYLLSRGADPALKSKEGTTAFTQSIMGILMERVTIEAAELFLETGADVDEAAATGATAGYTCLMMAARNKRPDLVKFLVEKGANVNAKAADGATPLSLAAKENDSDMIALLKKLGAK